MGKKSKEPRSNLKSNGESNSASASSNIFKTLFGDIPEQGTSISIFSDNNPFRRKPNDCSQTLQQQQRQEQPHQTGLGFDSLEDIGSPNGDSLNLNAGEVKKRKRNKEKIAKSNNALDSIAEASSETPSEIKKSKKDKLESPDLNTKSKKGGKGKEKKSNENSDEDDGGPLNLGVESKESSGKDQRTNPNLGMEIGGKGKEQEKKKKKRKRDELEAEYEEKRYGVKDETGEGRLGGGAVGEKRKTLDNPEDMLVSKEGFDDEDKLSRTVFVGNLPLKVKKKALLREFSQFGEVESVRIRSVPIVNSKTPRKGAIIKKQINDSVDSVNAYIVFKTEESARASLSHNMAVIGGNHIRVDRACPPRKKLKGENALLYDNKRTVFVGNLPFDVKDEEIYQLFSGIKNLESSIEAARVIRDPGTSVGKGIAYVLFKTRDAANLVVKKRNIKIRDRELRLSHAKSNSTPSKREISSPGERNNYPAKKLAMDSTSRAPYRNNTMKSTANISYQGLRASKSGVQKKVHTKITEPTRLKSTTQKVQKVKGRSGKRPSVEARKANAMKGSGGGGLKQGGGKRKMESRTPESARRNKKARKSR